MRISSFKRKRSCSNILARSGSVAVYGDDWNNWALVRWSCFFVATDSSDCVENGPLQPCVHDWATVREQALVLVVVRIERVVCPVDEILMRVNGCADVPHRRVEAAEPCAFKVAPEVFPLGLLAISVDESLHVRDAVRTNLIWRDETRTCTSSSNWQS